MRVRAAAAIASALVALVACSTFGSSGDTAADAGPPDGSAPPPPSDAAQDVVSADDAEAGGPAIYTDGFEMGGTSCGDWMPSTATAVRTSASARTGSWSCHFCATGAAQGYVAKSIASAAAGTYSLTVWMSAESDAGTEVTAGIIAYSGGTNVGTIGFGEVTLPPDGTFGLLQAVGDSDAGSMDKLYIQLSTPMGQCVDFDDVELDRTP